jgi:hypothetical protein
MRDYGGRDPLPTGRQALRGSPASLLKIQKIWGFGIIREILMG